MITFLASQTQPEKSQMPHTKGPGFSSWPVAAAAALPRPLVAAAGGVAGVPGGAMTKFWDPSCQSRLNESPASGKPFLLNDASRPRTNAESPSFVTVKVVGGPSGTPSACATIVWVPAPKLLKFQSSPKPLLASPHCAIESARGVRYAASSSCVPSITTVTLFASQTQPEMTLMPLWKEP